MPPLVPESMNSIFDFASSAPRRIESWKFELPPSMMMSPAESSGWSVAMVWSTGSPAGTMIQTTRGFASAATTAARSAAGVAPIDLYFATVSALRSKTTSLWP